MSSCPRAGLTALWARDVPFYVVFFASYRTYCDAVRMCALYDQGRPAVLQNRVRQISALYDQGRPAVP